MCTLQNVMPLRTSPNVEKSESAAAASEDKTMGSRDLEPTSGMYPVSTTSSQFWRGLQMKEFYDDFCDAIRRSSSQTELFSVKDG